MIFCRIKIKVVTKYHIFISAGKLRSFGGSSVYKVLRTIIVLVMLYRIRKVTHQYTGLLEQITGEHYEFLSTLHIPETE